MKQRILVTALAGAMLVLTGCSTTKTASDPIDPGRRANTAISEQRLATSEFRRQGVRITYTFGGDIESIEATGYAPVWGNSQSATREAFRVAELEAKKSLNDFINKESIKSATSVRMISKNLEKAQDNKVNNFATNRPNNMPRLITSDEEVDAPKKAENAKEENTAIRNDALEISSRVENEIITQNQGILSGLYLVEGRIINDGKTVQALYRWDRKSADTRVQVRNIMAQ
jgi:hypothetical protein